jgi:hypothetical protein
VCVCVCVRARAGACVWVALEIRDAIHMYRTVLSSLACVALRNVSTFSHKWKDIRAKATEHKMCVDFLCKICLKHFATKN